MTAQSEVRLTKARGALVQALGEEEDAYGKLAALAELEHVAILSASTEQLTSLLVEKERLIGRVVALEARRTASLGEIARQSGIPEQGFTLTALLESWSGDEREPLARLQESLRRHIQALAQMNKRNASLLRSSLILLARWTNLIGVEQQPQAYTRGGRRNRRSTPAVVNREA